MFDYHPEQGWSVAFWLLGTRREFDLSYFFENTKATELCSTGNWIQGTCAFLDHYTRVFRFHHSTLFFYIRTLLVLSMSVDVRSCACLCPVWILYPVAVASRRELTQTDILILILYTLVLSNLLFI